MFTCMLLACDHAVYFLDKVFVNLCAKIRLILTSSNSATWQTKMLSAVKILFILASMVFYRCSYKRAEFWKQKATSNVLWRHNTARQLRKKCWSTSRLHCCDFGTHQNTCFEVTEAEILSCWKGSRKRVRFQYRSIIWQRKETRCCENASTAGLS